ncbi:efflux RND transporter periplasmic adaptor subunit [Pseudooceanicola sp. LIPI14-2-Ac024]|uniref:efflux RND transporter periplasmic adaptor subunit n=1 Tax=Pseudooceanicola sp. LIPI14-2-Ac024 TaxID=3344875 RepID=UPI0035D0177B
MKTPVAFVAALLAAGPVLSQEASQNIRPVKLMTIKAEETLIERQFFGRVAAKSTVDLAFQAGGQMAEFAAREGQFVAGGEVLARLDTTTFERNVAKARADLAQAHRDLARSEELGRDVVPQASIEAQRTKVELAEVSYESALDTLEDATLIAPFDALVSSQLAEQYATVGAGQAVVRVHDMSALQVTIEVPEVLFRQVGREAAIAAEAELIGNEPAVPLEFSEITAEASPVGQTYSLSFTFDGPLPDRLLPGSSATVTLRLTRPAARSEPLLPISAVRFAADGTPEVLIFEAGTDADHGTLRRHPVTIAPGPSGTFRLHDGPPAGTEIVAAGAAGLAAGTEVRRYTGLIGNGA